MGEKTSTNRYEGMTPAQIAATLTSVMKDALATGIGIDRPVSVAGRSGTIVALIERGLVTAGRENTWTHLGGDVARLVLGVHVPTHAQAERRKLDGYYEAETPPRPMDIVQTPNGAIGVVETVNLGGEVLVRNNIWESEHLSMHDAHVLRSIPPVAYLAAGVPTAVTERSVPRDFATTELARRAMVTANRYAPETRLTINAQHADARREYGRAYVYAIASMLDATRLLAARCPNGWHRSAHPRSLQTCADCRVPLTDPVAEPVVEREQGTEAERAIRLLAGELGVPLAPPQIDPATDNLDELLGRIRKRAQYVALRKMLDVLDATAEVMRDNAIEMGHDVLDDAASMFTRGDIRSMVAAAARELGTADPTRADRPS